MHSREAMGPPSVVFAGSVGRPAGSALTCTTLDRRKLGIAPTGMLMTVASAVRVPLS